MVIEAIDDPSVFSTTALVSRGWRTRSQALLFHGIELGECTSLHRFRKLIATSPHIAKYIKQLRLTDSRSMSLSLFSAPETFEKLENVRSLRMTQFMLAREDEASFVDDFIRRLPLLTRVDFIECVLSPNILPRVIGAFPAIASLTIFSCRDGLLFDDSDSSQEAVTDDTDDCDDDDDIGTMRPSLLRFLCCDNFSPIATSALVRCTFEPGYLTTFDIFLASVYDLLEKVKPSVKDLHFLRNHPPAYSEDQVPTAHSIHSLSLYITSFKSCFDRLLPPTHPTPHSLDTLKIIIHGHIFLKFGLDSVTTGLHSNLREVGRLVRERRVPRLVMAMTPYGTQRFRRAEFENMVREHLGIVGPEECQVGFEWDYV